MFKATPNLFRHIGIPGYYNLNLGWIQPDAIVKGVLVIVTKQ